jgi:hypothetical protein
MPGSIPMLGHLPISQSTSLVVIGSNLDGLVGINLFQACAALYTDVAGGLCLYAASIVVTCLISLAYMCEKPQVSSQESSC